MHNDSPWIAQLRVDREIKKLENNIQADILIIGGGIAGITTAYQILQQTKRNVVLVEGRKIGHGATGHNAGQLVGRFERPLESLLKEYGHKKTVQALKALEIEAWILLESIIQQARLTVPYSTFLGYSGFVDIKDLITELEYIYFHKENDLPYHPSFVSKDAGILEHIPKKYHSLCVEIAQEDIARVLETTRADFIAAVSSCSKIGCMNSALFTEQLAEYCLKEYSNRFSIYEQTHVERIVLAKDSATVITKEYAISCAEVVLCTNGFEHFSIENTMGTDINTKFHHNVTGVVGYMTSYYDTNPIPSDRWYYLPKKELPESMQNDAYFYVTRRPFEAPAPYTGLICIGGPEIALHERKLYNPEHSIDDVIKKDLFDFTTNNLINAKSFKHRTFWHGLMGYTRSKVRLIGPEPCNPILMYNLGCNGIGILPSVYGAFRIAKYVNGEEMEETVFDPQDSTCAIDEAL